MILADTSVWIDHLRSLDYQLVLLLEKEQIMVHPFVLGELALGHLRKRDEVLRMLADLPAAPVVTEPEMLHFIDRNALAGSGIGYVDAHLLASVSLAEAGQLFTYDKRLKKLATGLCLGITGR